MENRFPIESLSNLHIRAFPFNNIKYIIFWGPEHSGKNGKSIPDFVGRHPKSVSVHKNEFPDFSRGWEWGLVGNTRIRRVLLL